MKSKLNIAVIFFSACLMAFTHISHGMIRTLPVSELISTAEHIVIAEVYQITKTGYTPESKLSLLKNELKVTETLKGTLSQNEPIIINTMKAEDWIEDNVEIPLPGSKVFLFLKKDEKGEFRPVNGIQGIWPMQGEKLLGMGTRYKVDDIRKMIKQSK
ncbi:MAG: hypothetical protein FJ240_10675 [Nitrospira sp.]|nr:hypothetical protein [Nitrospira sp.]